MTEVGKEGLVLESRSYSNDNVETGINGGGTHSDAGGIEDAKESELSSVSVILESKMNGEVMGVEKVKDLPMSSTGSPVARGGSEGPAMKGKGLKKWRRMRRDTSKDSCQEVASSRILKRSSAAEESSKTPNDNKQKNDDGEIESSVASVNIENSGSGPQMEAHVRALDPQLAELLVSGVGFSVGADSDNSEDRSSKSSTAASAPRHKHEGFGFGRERSRVKNFSGKGSGHMVQQRGHRGKGEFDSSKKIREDQSEIRVENSRSSIESDLRSFNAVSMLWGSTSSNGRQERNQNYDEENSNEALVTEALQTGYYKENGGHIEELSRSNFCDDEGTKEERREEDDMVNFHIDEDPFSESLSLLQEAQETLEKEIQKFTEIGKMPNLVPDYSSGQSYSEGGEENDSLHPESKLACLNQKVVQLERVLEQTSRIAKARELKVLELEQILHEFHLPNAESEDRNSLELEFEDLFKKKLEAEIECLALRRATKTWKVMVEDNFALLEEQKSLLEEYDQLVVRLGDAEGKAIMLKSRAEDVEASCAELLGRDGVLVLQNGVCKFSLCLFLQIVMFCVALWLFLLQLFFPHSSEVVPT